MFKRVLAIGAHPDDLEYSCFGFLCKLRDQGADIKAYIASSGCTGDPTSGFERVNESLAAFHAFASDAVVVRNVPGLLPTAYEEVSTELRNLILKHKPDLILTHHGSDSHQEHRLLKDITITAARRIACSIWAYKSVSVTSDFEESVYVDVSDYLEEKKQALGFHVSQKSRNYMQESYINDYHKSWFGLMHGLNEVEVYSIVRLVI